MPEPKYFKTFQKIGLSPVRIGTKRTASIVRNFKVEPPLPDGIAHIKIEPTIKGVGCPISLDVDIQLKRGYEFKVRRDKLYVVKKRKKIKPILSPPLVSKEPFCLNCGGTGKVIYPNSRSGLMKCPLCKGKKRKKIKRKGR